MKIGFIGAGNMAMAVLTGIHKANIINSSDIYVSNRSKAKLDVIEKEFSYKTSIDNSFVCDNAKDIIFLCVKPQIFDSTLCNEIKNKITKDHLIVSILAGKSIEYLQEKLGTKNVVRVMPNTPCLVGAGICAVATTNDVKEKMSPKFNLVMDILKSIGEAVEVDEKYINAITQVSGASPAWVFMMIEALADGGVLCGMPRDMAYKFAESAVMGSGKLATIKNIHPGILKDMVTSPAGTTIEGVKVLEEKGFRGAIIDAVVASYNKSIKL